MINLEGLFSVRYKLKMSQFRYERKYIIENLSTQKVNLIIKSHPHLFKKKYDARFVNSLYLDSLDYSFYNDHVIGKSDRYKIRVRWYNNLYEEIQKPVLEIKTKKNYLGKKEYYYLNRINFHKNLQVEKLNKFIRNSNIPEKVKILNIKPVLINRYLRNYFESADKKYRITVDTNLTYYPILSDKILFTKVHHDKNIVIMELKYGVDAGDYASKITNHFPFRTMKSSKYIRGIQITRDVII